MRRWDAATTAGYVWGSAALLAFVCTVWLFYVAARGH